MKWLLFIAIGVGIPVHAGQIARLAETHAASGGQWRWRDVIGNVYAEDYRLNYTYAQAAVLAEVDVHGALCRGKLTAAGLKPNFAYQIKLEAVPDAACANALGNVGRWWRETWNTALQAWSSGWNLNTKGTGISPTPNDLQYADQADDASPSSPTGRMYRFTPYAVVGYFVTDAAGQAKIDFEFTNSYHVLWKSGQGYARGPNDGPPVQATVLIPDASPAYMNTNAQQGSTAVFAEWERLPLDQIRLAEGVYELYLQLNEESFHEDDLPHGGFWAPALRASVSFTIGKLPEFATHPESLVLAPGSDAVLSAGLTEAGADSLQWLHDGHPVPNATEAVLDLASVTEEDDGVYVCEAVNAMGTSRSEPALVLVRPMVPRQEHERLIAERDTIIRDQEQSIAAMYTADELGRLLTQARPDRDGDGYTDAQEEASATDPQHYAITVNPGWNLLSLARIPEDNSLAGIFGDKTVHVQAAYRWSPQRTYEAVDTIIPETGTWLYWTGDLSTIEIHLPEAEAE